MTHDRDLRPDHEMEGRVSSWLTDTDLSPDEANAGLARLLDEFPVTPQARRRFLGRWLERDEGAGRRTTERDHPPPTDRRTRFMFSATGAVAALAILALAINVVDTTPAPPGADAGATHVVAADSSGDFTTIGAAVDAAGDGDTILVRPGTYTEAVVIDKDLTVAGDGPRGEIVITAPEEGPEWVVDFSYIITLPYAVVADGADVTLRGLTFRGLPSRVFFDGGASIAEDLYLDGVGEYFTGSDPSETGGIVINGETTATVRGSTFRGGGEIDVYDYSNAIIEDNEMIDGPNVAGLFGPETIVSGNRIIGSGFQGIVFLGATQAIFTDNIIEGRQRAIGKGIGISIGANHAPVIERNQISGADTAIDLVGSAGARVVDNTVRDAWLGLDLGNSEGLVAGNTIEGTTAGIVVSGPATIEGNRVEGNVTGISVAGASPSLTGNVVCGNETNLALLGDADPILEDNEICAEEPQE